ncbi:hypothetical protein [Paracoccus benzoatiresistens]|uniref:Uncharacterized protein n=1 Tax=Paracoccus benzoatiresistens TaxID=2997341 RepID=A0ABT4JAK6_9RHOB|nr:hypothetical protein [Paracoccus sp. EF6]MCZ0963506.1 hypothetical protein [Paracoccus sp. EF6]
MVRIYRYNGVRSLSGKKGCNPARLIDGALYPQVLEPLTDVDRDDGDAVRECFEQMCHAIRVRLGELAAELEEPLTGRKAGRPSGDLAKIYNDLRLKTYMVVREMERLGVWEHVDALVARATPGRRAKNLMTRRFIDVLFFLSQSEGSILLERKVLADFANQLAYAHRHDVPFQFLLGFLAEIGFDEAARKERADQYEIWHPKRPRKSDKDGRSKKISKG